MSTSSKFVVVSLLLIHLACFIEARLVAATTTLPTATSATVGQSTSNTDDTRTTTTPPQTVFPTLDETLHLAYLSSLVYDFRHHLHDERPYCDVFNNEQQNNNNDPNNNNDEVVNSTADSNPQLHGVQCLWYHVEPTLGTQILIVVNHQRKYFAVVYAGTDNVRTMLEDSNISLMKFGSNESHVRIPLTTTDDVDSNNDKYYYYNHAKIHAGFNHAIFTHDIYPQVEQQIHKFYSQRKRFHKRSYYKDNYKLYVTGHSLGAANAMITSIALAIRKNEEESKKKLYYVPHITSINFGCPQTGNSDWKDYINDILLSPHTTNNKTTNEYSNINNNTTTVITSTIRRRRRSSSTIDDESKSTNEIIDNDHVTLSKSSNLGGDVSLWRIVLGWDLVPRLPELFHHVGHTIQIWSKNHEKYDKNTSPSNRVEAYYHHYGNEELNYAGVPIGWSSKPYVWVPGAINEHFITNYIDHLKELQQDEEKEERERLVMVNATKDTSPHGSIDVNVKEELWVTEFKRIDDDDDNKPDVVADDDFWVGPPDDYVSSMEYDIYYGNGDGDVDGDSNDDDDLVEEDDMLNSDKAELLSDIVALF